jgi:adenylate kinase family enzyme
MKIMIFGRPGSGKSTFAFALAQKLALPLHHLDKHFFTANWVERNYEEFLDIQYNIVDQKEWIIDGNSLHSLNIRYSEADICIYFNYPRWLCFLRLIKRRFTKNPAIDDRALGCKEKTSWRLIKYMWTFEYRLNNRLALKLQILDEMFHGVKFYTVRNDQELKQVMKLLIDERTARSN